jgi:hypothetical protein
LKTWFFPLWWLRCICLGVLFCQVWLCALCIEALTYDAICCKWVRCWTCQKWPCAQELWKHNLIMPSMGAWQYSEWMFLKKTLGKKDHVHVNMLTWWSLCVHNINFHLWTTITIVYRKVCMGNNYNQQLSNL